MTLTRIYRWLRKVYALLVALAALSGIGPGALPPSPAPPPAIAPAPPAPGSGVTGAKKVIGQCATGSSGPGQWFATCIVDGAQSGLPGLYPSRAAAQQAIRDYRAANA